MTMTGKQSIFRDVDAAQRAGRTNAPSRDASIVIASDLTWPGLSPNAARRSAAAWIVTTTKQGVFAKENHESVLWGRRDGPACRSSNKR